MRFRIIPPIGNTRSPLNVETLLNSVHKSLSSASTISLCLESDAGHVGYAADVPDEQRVVFIQELQDAYPGTLVRVREPKSESSDREAWYTSVRLRPDLLSIRTFDKFVDFADDRLLADPVAGLLASIRSGQSGTIDASIALELCPATKRQVRVADKILRRYRYRFNASRVKRLFIRWATSDSFVVRRMAALLYWFSWKPTNETPAEVEKTGDNVFQSWITVRIVVPVGEKELANRKVNDIVAAFGRFTDGDTEFEHSRLRPRLKRMRPSLLTSKEIATLWHPLTESGDTVSRVERPTFREIEAPVMVASKKGVANTTMLGRLRFRQQRSQFGIGPDDLRRHLLAIGKTGCGKSTFLLNVIRQQIELNRGVILIDPHGQLADEVLDVIPKRRTNDVIVFDASDRIAPVGFNPMVGPKGTDPTLIADGVLTSFKNVFGFEDGSAPRLLHIFRNCLLSLIGTSDASLAGVQRLLVDAAFRKSIVARVDNAAVREFWLTEFNRWNERDRTQYIASLQNKLGAFTTNERLQAILNPGEQGIQLRDVMDSSGILICNLSKGTVGHDASTLLGSLLLSSLQVAAMSRADIRESERTDCTVVVDEFHSYLTDGNSTMADALAESRKYRTSYVLSTQMLEQLDPATLAGVLGNCGSTLCMTVGPRDAEVLTELLGSGLSKDDLMKIPKYHAYLRMLVDGAPHTFSMTTLPPPTDVARRSATIRRVSRQRHGQTAAQSGRTTCLEHPVS
tara:strand:+ start:737869 stop:740088 length:2220 start_codon:yes stop_codon:yes gene_type:complete